MPDRPERRRNAWEGAGIRDTAAPKRRLTSRDLLAGRDEIIIDACRAGVSPAPHTGRETDPDQVV
jgi:hypothetical protein